MLWDCNIKSSRNSLNRATGKQVAGLLVFLSFCTIQCFLECGCFINSVISKAMLSQCQTCLLLFSYCAELYMPELHIPAMPFTFALFDCPWESRPSVLVLEHLLHSAHSRKASLCSVAIAELRYSHIGMLLPSWADGGSWLWSSLPQLSDLAIWRPTVLRRQGVSLSRHQWSCSSLWVK